MKLIKKGAEADIYSLKWKDHPAILKIRKSKKYRDPILDSRIKKQRTYRESEILSYVKSFGIPTPLVYFVDTKNSSIIMQAIPGKPVHDLPDSKIINLSFHLGRLVATLHKNKVMHGDLTTSNFIFYKNKIYVIDFGLSQKTTKLEDYAVDLRLIKEILNSAHAQIMKKTWKNFLKGYKTITGSSNFEKIMALVMVIEGRGRYANVV